VEYKIKPYEWQERAIGLGSERDYFALLADMGTGKTGAMINIIRTIFNTDKRKQSVMIFTPLSVIGEWISEFEKHSNISSKDIVRCDRIFNRHGNFAKKTPLLKDALDGKKILLLNYDAVSRDTYHNFFLHHPPDIMVLDESHLIKNPQAQRTKFILKLGALAGRRYIMTGTAILNNVSDIFTQVMFLDKGKTFGTNLIMFKKTYMVDKNDWKKGRVGYFPNWQNKQTAFPKLLDKISPLCIRVKKEECLDLPPLIQVVREVELTEEQKKLYITMAKECIAWADEQDLTSPFVAETATTKLLRLQQIVSGFCKQEDGTIVKINNNRLNVLTDILDDVYDGTTKIIIWAVFKQNYLDIAEVLTKKGITYAILTGEQTLVEKERYLTDFRQGSTNVLIANQRAGGTGINLAEASYSFYYSRNFSLGDHLQSQARNYRGGSEVHEKVTQVTLISKGTIDEEIGESLSGKHDTLKNIIDKLKAIMPT